MKAEKKNNLKMVKKVSTMLLSIAMAVVMLAMAFPVETFARTFNVQKTYRPGDVIWCDASEVDFTVIVSNDCSETKMYYWNYKKGHTYWAWFRFPEGEEFGTPGGNYYYIGEKIDPNTKFHYYYFWVGYSEYEGGIHDYEYCELKAPTSIADGEEAFVCRRCGHVTERAAIPAAIGWKNEILDLIRVAQPGQRIYYNSTTNNSIPQDIMVAMSTKTNVIFDIEFIYNNQHIMISIPSDACDTSLEWYGPEKLMQLYPYVIK